MKPSLTAFQVLNKIPATGDHNSNLDQQQISYCGTIEELIWLLVTCRPVISFASIKLSQFLAAPASIHYDAVQKIFCYLKATPVNGITYWHPKPILVLPVAPFPMPFLPINN